MYSVFIRDKFLTSQEMTAFNKAIAQGAWRQDNGDVLSCYEEVVSVKCICFEMRCLTEMKFRLWN